MKRSQIQIRDPFVLPVKEQGLYYLYGTTDTTCWGDQSLGFDVYTSNDLEEWNGPYPAFRADENFWANKNFWAPEVHKYNGKYYMFASFKKKNVCRGTQILIADSPQGPFVPNSPGPVTPEAWECLDGTLFIDDDENPWIIFCHEWLQIFDGGMYAMRLNRNLDEAEGKPFLLFKASQAPWTVGFTHDFGSTKKECCITDGPFIYRNSNGELLMLWSSCGAEGYTTGVARSESGNILGLWKHESEPIYKKDGGHGMIFKTFDDKLMMTFHAPNRSPDERAVFKEIIEKNGMLMLI